MYYFDGIIVVEGTGDSSYLSSFIDSEFIVTNGYNIDCDTLDYLSNVKNRLIIMFTDPDEAGRLIENRLKKLLPNSLCLCVNLNKCIKNKKHGIAECEMLEIIRVLHPYLKENISRKFTISKHDFIRLNLMTVPEKRAYICNKLHLGQCNSKTLFKRLNYNFYTKEDIIKLWK